MPSGCYFINAIERQEIIDDDNLNVDDNLEEFISVLRPLMWIITTLKMIIYVPEGTFLSAVKD
jgi:hypothetical protein